MIKTGNPVISIYTEMTPNPETMKFVANKLLYPGKSIDFLMRQVLHLLLWRSNCLDFLLSKLFLLPAILLRLQKLMIPTMAGCDTFNPPIFERIPGRRQSRDQ